MPNTTTAEAADFLELKAAAKQFRAAITKYRQGNPGQPKGLLDGTPVPIEPSLLDGARLIADRRVAFEHIPSHAVACEVGVQTGQFSKELFEKYDLAELHLVDSRLDKMTVAYEDVLLGSRVFKHEGMSWDVLATFPNDKFDWIYIDAAHDYAAVKKDLEQACRVVKPGGYVIYNDYTTWSWSEGVAYGVVAAVNECVNERKWPVRYLALNHMGYHDLAFQRPSTTRPSHDAA